MDEFWQARKTVQNTVYWKDSLGWSNALAEAMASHNATADYDNMHKKNQILNCNAWIISAASDKNVLAKEMKNNVLSRFMNYNFTVVLPWQTCYRIYNAYIISIFKIIVYACL